MIEVRVITYKRPHLLKRALSSLLAQTHVDWRAVVYDDSKQFESHQVVQELDDPRITVVQNLRNLGMIGNLSQAFAKNAIFTDSIYACILEDDNAFEPTWLEENLVTMKHRMHSVMVRNYKVVDILSDGSFVQNSSQPMRSLYGDSAREISLAERIKEAFFSFTLGTSCYFWRLNAGVDLRFPEERLHGPVMEAGRALSFPQACWYEPQPLSIFSRFIDKKQTPRSETPNSTLRRRLTKVSEIEFTRRLCHLWIHDLGLRISSIIELARTRLDGHDALQRLAEAGCWQAWEHLRDKRCWIAAAKALAVGALYHRSWREYNQQDSSLL